MSPEVQGLIGQLGASGIFMAGIVIVAKAFYQHYEEEIKYLRCKVDALEQELRGFKASLK